jgi:ABC-type sugar transport system ATPase subunit
LMLRGAGFAWAAPAWLAAQAPRPDQVLTLGIRPQSLSAVRTDPQYQLSLLVDVVEYLGTESQIVGHMNTPGGQRVSAIVPGNAQDQLHKSCHLSFQPDEMHVFDTETGWSLRPI